MANNLILQCLTGLLIGIQILEDLSALQTSIDNIIHLCGFEGFTKNCNFPGCLSILDQMKP